MTSLSPRRLVAGLALALTLAAGLAGCTGDPDASDPDASDPCPRRATRVPLSTRPSLGRPLSRRRAGSTGKHCDASPPTRGGATRPAWSWRVTAALVGGVEPGRARPRPPAPSEVFSVTKSVTSTLVGIAEADSKLTRRRHRGIAVHPRVARDPTREKVTVRQPAGQRQRPVLEPDHRLRRPAARDRTGRRTPWGWPSSQPPGEVSAYNNAAIQTLDRVLVGATGEPVSAFARERLFTPLGMADTSMTPDASGRSTNLSFGLRSTCRDLARFGQLFAQRGTWDGETVVPELWVEAAVGAPSQEKNAAYGLLWWLNRYGPLRGPLNTLDGQAPPDVRAVDGWRPGSR